jgi:signal transduction histidine kinase
MSVEATVNGSGVATGAAGAAHQLVAVVSHEIRAPLTSILGYSELMAFGLLSPEQMRAQARKIYREARRLSALADDLLEIERLESGRVALRPRPVALAPLVREAIDRAADETEVHQLAADLPPHLPPVWGDAGQLAQVIDNLVSNAIKYSPNGGPVTVSARQAGLSVSVAVTDQGLGIAPEHQPRLFERFYRVPGDERRGIAGTGLGLAIVKHIVEAHGGAVDVTSTLGHGSCFSFTIPVAAAVRRPNRRPAAA